MWFAEEKEESNNSAHFSEFGISKWDPVILVWKSEDEWTPVACDTLGSRDTEMEVLPVVKKGDQEMV